MSKVWDVPFAVGTVLLAHLQGIEDALESLRTLHSSGAAPTTTVAGMLWYDTTNKRIFQRDSGDSAWSELLAVGVRNHAFTKIIRIGGLAGSDNYWAGTFNENVALEEVVICSDTASAGSDGSNNYSMQLRNHTAAADLLATAWDTNLDAEIAADAATIITLDQNLDVAKNDLLEFQIVETGTATDLSAAEICLELRGEIRGA